MKNVLILGASGSVARTAIDLFLEKRDVQLSLYLRKPSKLKGLDAKRVRLIEGDVLDASNLERAMAGQDVVYANLAGELEAMAHAIVTVMHAAHVRRLIFISSMGIYDEVPGEQYGAVLEPYRKAAQVIEASDLDYTLLRPAWFTSVDEIDYQLAQKGEPFKGSSVSRKSVAALVVELALSPDLHIRRSLGVSKPS
jgi:uncharacterized protein YbjT (DUF2867 family)